MTQIEQFNINLELLIKAQAEEVAVRQKQLDHLQAIIEKTKVDIAALDKTDPRWDAYMQEHPDIDENPYYSD